MDKVTEWFPASVKPVRNGMYEVKNVIHNGLIFKAFWSNGTWFNGDFKTTSLAVQDRTWRGLATPK